MTVFSETQNGGKLHLRTKINFWCHNVRIFLEHYALSGVKNAAVNRTSVVASRPVVVKRTKLVFKQSFWDFKTQKNLLLHPVSQITTSD